MMDRLCCHCHAAPVSRPRGLCWACYYRPGLRELYPSTSKFACTGARDFNGPAAAPPATSARPGTPEKLAVLEERARLGQDLSSPADAPVDPS